MAKKKEPINTIERDGKIFTIMNTNVSDGRVLPRSIALEYYVQKVNKGEICRDVLSQRLEGQWSNRTKSELIVSILQNRPIGEILITSERMYGAMYMSQSILDGLQRTDALCGYLNNKFALSKNIKPLSCICKSEDGETIECEIDIAGKKFSQLPPTLQWIIRNYNIFMYEYVGFTDEELDRIIYNINNGVPFKPNQKLRLAFGTKNMKYIQPVCDNAIWDNINGCKAKNDSILGCVTRTMMMLLEYDCDFSSAEMSNFAEEFDVNVDNNQYLLRRINKLFDRLNDMVCDARFTEEDAEFFNACNIPHIIEALDGWIGTDEQFMDFLVSFLHSSAKTEYNKYAATKSGSGAKQYSYESVSSRRGVIINAMTDYIADNNIKKAEKTEGETDEEAETVDSTDDIRNCAESHRSDGEGESEKLEQLLPETFEDNECGQNSQYSEYRGSDNGIELSQQSLSEWEE